MPKAREKAALAQQNNRGEIMKVVLSLDQSTTATGWGLFINDTLIGHGIYKPSGNREKRINDTEKWLVEKVREVKNSYPQGDIKVVLEDIQMQRNVETFKSLAHLQGVLINCLYGLFQESEIQGYKVYFSSAWKSTCGIKGRRRAEQKKNAQNFVERRYGIVAEEDACDAICIGIHHNEEVNSEINFE